MSNPILHLPITIVSTMSLIDQRHPLLRTWLFGPGADSAAHDAMSVCGADVLIQDLEDFTPPPRRDQARALAAGLFVAGGRSVPGYACASIHCTRTGRWTCRM